MNLRRLTRTLNIAGAIGGALTVIATIIRAIEPKANDMPLEYHGQIRKLVHESVKEELRHKK